MKLIKTLVTTTALNAVILLGLMQFAKSSPVTLTEPTAVVASPTVPSPTLAPVQRPVAVAAKPKVAKPVTKPAVPTQATAAPAAQAEHPPTPAPKPTGCVIQIDGVRYEITSLRRTHSGGDIFQCGTDMSQVFWSRHNQQILQRMEQYKI